MGCRKKLAGLESDLSAVSARITMMGGVIVPYEKLAAVRVQHQQLAETFNSALTQIIETGCVIKDLDVGLLDFPAIIDHQDVYLCWKLGEDRIRFYHRQDEGFSGRKPLDPARPRRQRHSSVGIAVHSSVIESAFRGAHASRPPLNFPKGIACPPILKIA